MTVFDGFVSCGLDDPMTSLGVLAGEQGRPAPAEAAVRDALSRALGAS
jgi:lipoyl(octanoyl) transferase